MRHLKKKNWIYAKANTADSIACQQLVKHVSSMSAVSKACQQLVKNVNSHHVFSWGTLVHSESRILTYADVCWLMLTYADVCWLMLTYADVCWRMLTYADTYAGDVDDARGSRWRMLTYADVCGRMRTYADVCWRMLTHVPVMWMMPHAARLLTSSVALTKPLA